MLITLAAPFAVALALSLALVPLCRLVALRVGFVATPREDRWHPGADRRELSRGAAGRDRWLPGLQRSSGIDFHGRQRQPAARLQHRGGDAEHRPAGARTLGRALDRRRAGAGPVDPDLRHDA